MTAATPDVAVLWRALHERLTAFVRRRVPSAFDADDVVQDVFVRAQVGLSRAGRVDDVEAWLFRIARSAVADWYRRRGKVLPGDAPDTAALPADEPDEPDAAEGLVACMHPFVDALPPRYREAVTLVDLEGLKHAEAAERLGLSISGVKSRVQRGRAHLRGLLDACCRFELDGRGRVIEAVPKACACGGEPTPGC